jgi:hypothetical protein
MPRNYWQSIVLVALIVTLFSLTCINSYASVIVTYPENIILVPPYRYTCVNLTFYNTDNTTHIINLEPNTNFATLPYVLGSKFSVLIFTLPPYGKRNITICFKPAYVPASIMSNYTIRIFVEGKLYKQITLKLWYNSYYNFSASVIVMPPKIFLDKVNVLIKLHNSGTIPDNYSIRIYIDSRLVKNFSVHLIPGEVRFFYYIYKPNESSIKLINLKIEIFSETSVCRKSFSFRLIKLINPLIILTRLLKNI